MAYIKQYPHYLFVVEPPVAVQDERGVWRTDSGDTGATPRLVGRCREETGGRGSIITLQGGVAYTFTALVQLPRGSERIGEGSRVIVSNDAEGMDIRLEGVCMKYSEDQLHHRLWI